MEGLYATLKKFVPDKAMQDKITDQFPLFRNAERSFGSDLAVRQRKKKSPGENGGKLMDILLLNCKGLQ